MKRTFTKYPSSISARTEITASTDSDNIQLIKQIIDDCVIDIVEELNDEDISFEYIGQAFRDECIRRMKKQLLDPEWVAEYAEYMGIPVPTVSKEILKSPKIQLYLADAFEGYGASEEEFED